MRGLHYEAVRVFSATRYADRARLGEVVTQWLAEHPELRPVGQQVRQSSDDSFHCLSITVFFRRSLPGK